VFLVNDHLYGPPRPTSPFLLLTHDLSTFPRFRVEETALEKFIDDAALLTLHLGSNRGPYFFFFVLSPLFLTPPNIFSRFASLSNSDCDLILKGDARPTEFPKPLVPSSPHFFYFLPQSLSPPYLPPPPPQPPPPFPPQPPPPQPTPPPHVFRVPSHGYFECFLLSHVSPAQPDRSDLLTLPFNPFK